MFRRGLVHAVPLLPSGDGLTFPFFIVSHETPPIHPPLRGTYRPVGLQERTDIQIHLENKTGRAWNSEAARALRGRIKTWDATTFDAEKKVVPLALTDENLLTVEPVLFNALCSVILFGTRPSDTDPTWTEEDMSLQERAQIEASVSGRSVNEVLMELQAKNSNTGSACS